MKKPHPLAIERARKGYSQVSFSNASGIHEATIWRIESDRTRKIHPNTAFKIAETLGISLEKVYSWYQ